MTGPTVPHRYVRVFAGFCAVLVAAVSLVFGVAVPALADEITATVSVAPGVTPNGIAISKDGTFALTANVSSNDVSRLDLSTSPPTVEARIDVGAGPFFVAISPDGSFALVTNMNENNVSRIRLSDNVVEATIPVGIEPQGVAISPDGSYALVANHTNPGGAGSGVVTRIDTSDNSTHDIANVGSSLARVAISNDGTFALVTNGTDGHVVSRIETDSEVISSIGNVGNTPMGVAISPEDTFAYVTDSTDGNLIRINTLTNEVEGSPIPIGAFAFGVAISPNGTFAYATSYTANTVTRVETATDAISETIPLGVSDNPFDVAIAPGNKYALVTNQTPSTVGVIGVTFTLGGITPAQGKTSGGSRVTISGTGISDGATATVGGVPCTDVNVSSATSLTCSTGPHVAGVSDVAVKNPDTQIATLAGAFRYTSQSGRRAQTVGPGVPLRIKSRGVTSINPLGARTRQGLPQAASVRAVLTRGDLACLRKIRGPARAVAVRTSGRCSLLIRVTYTAPGNSQYLPLRKAYAFRTRIVR